MCPYKEQGYCEGFDTEELTPDDSIKIEDVENEKEEHINELLERRDELLKEIKQIEEQLKKKINGTFKFKGKEIGWVDAVKREYNPRLLNKILQMKGIPAEERAKFFIVNWRKLNDLKNILTENEYKAIVTEKKVKKFKL
jgi:hypothetical protein